MKDRIAIIDLGTNTFHLLIAERDKHGFSFIYRERLAVRIGQRGINTNRIQPDAVERAVRALSSFKTTIDQHDAVQTIAFGTSALRNANNADEVVGIFREQTGINVTIISGEKEAELIFKGVQSALTLGNEKSLVMDIGGGSVEFIIGNEEQIFWKHSFEIGAQRLLERFQKHDPILPSEIEQLNAYFASELESLFTALFTFTPTTLVGSSGTFDTLSDIFCLKYGLPKGSNDSETPLTLKGFAEVFKELLVKDRAGRMQIPGMLEMRVDMIVVACCLIDFLISRYAFSAVRVSTYALKEGILHSLSPALAKNKLAI
jgi:exopolyphosphatase / guanosine-5'-triphosphate,3'-diphosphate pyrophosphatase